MKPWFPEVSADGEWEHRERHYRRYLRKATRVIVAGETGREQVVRFFGVAPENCLPLKHPTPDFALAAERTARSRRSQWYGAGNPVPLPAVSGTVLGAQEPRRRPRRARGAEVAWRGCLLVLVGSDKGQLDHVRAQVRERGLDDAVHILGYVEEDELVGLYQHAHALVYLSRFGPENLPPLEALALGCPAIVADVPGAAEQFGDAAIVVDPDDPSRSPTRSSGWGAG